MNTEDFSISTDRLLLAPTSLDFAEDIYREFTHEITRLMYPKPAESIEETQRVIKEFQDNKNIGEELVVVILEKNTREFLGCCGIHEIPSRKPHMGIWIKKSAHGNKYGREAVTAMYEWAKNNIDFDYFLYPVAKENINSRKIAESLGGKMIREFQNTNLSGITRDMVEYKIEKKATS